MEINWKNYNYILDKLTYYEDNGFTVKLIAYGGEDTFKAYPDDEHFSDFKLNMEHYYKKYGNIYRVSIIHPDINRIKLENGDYYRKLLLEFYSKIESKLEYIDGGTALILKDKE